MYNLFKYLSDWSCEYKRAFWFGLIFVDGGILTLDLSLLYYWTPFMNFMVTFFEQDLGRFIQYGVGISAMYLTWERIKQAKLVSRQIKKSLEE